MEVVADVCTTEQCLLNAKENIGSTDAATALEKQMLTKISHISTDQEIFGLIQESVKNTNDTATKVTLKHLFEIEKPAQKLAYSPFQRKLHNK